MNLLRKREPASPQGTFITQPHLQSPPVSFPPTDTPFTHKMPLILPPGTTSDNLSQSLCLKSHQQASLYTSYHQRALLSLHNETSGRLPNSTTTTTQSTVAGLATIPTNTIHNSHSTVETSKTSPNPCRMQVTEALQSSHTALAPLLMGGEHSAFKTLHTIPPDDAKKVPVHSSHQYFMTPSLHQTTTCPEDPLRNRKENISPPHTTNSSSSSDLELGTGPEACGSLLCDNNIGHP